MNLTCIVQPPFEPVSLEQCYKQLRLDPDIENSPAEPSHPDDAMLHGYIVTAREYVEKTTRRSLVLQTLRLSVSSCQRIRLVRPPFVRIESVGYWDGDNALQALEPTDYYVTDEQIPELRFGSGFSTPSVYDRPDALRVEYVAGHTPDGSPPTTQQEYAANIPSGLKDAVLLGVQLLYDNPAPAEREAIERMREAILQTFRIQHT